MKLTALIMLGICLTAKADSYSQQVTLQEKNKPLNKVLNEIKKQTGYVFFYDASILNESEPVTIRVKNEALDSVLKEVLYSRHLDFSIQNKTITIVKKIAISAKKNIPPPRDTFLVKGKIVSGGSPVENVSVINTVSGKGTQTDQDGAFGLYAATGDQLFVSHINYDNITLTVKGRELITLTLTAKSGSLTDVVVVGYGTQKKINLTGAVDQVGTEYFKDRPTPNLARSLQGAIPNLNIKMTDGKPTRGATYNIRGTTSIGSGGSALILIDGVPGDPNTLNPNDIESVTVLKDASSAAIYGSRAAYGVVLITTKMPKSGKIQINYSGNYTINKRTVAPELVSNGYKWASNFDEAYSSWYDYLSHPTSIDNKVPFSLAYLDSLRVHDENPGMPQYSIDPNTGRYVYYSNTDWMNELYNTHNPSMEHALSVSGGTEKVTYMISGKYYKQDGVFRYNNDKFNRYNLRFKGSVKATQWLTLSGLSDFSNYSYKYPLSTLTKAGISSIWTTLSQVGAPNVPLLNPDGSLTINGAYSIGDYYYGKSISKSSQTFLRNSLNFDATIIKNKLSLKGDFSYLYTNTDDRRKYFTVPYSIIPGEIITSGLNYISDDQTVQKHYVGNIYANYSDNFGRHSVGAVAGWNLEYDDISLLYVQRDGLLVDNLIDFNLASGDNYKLTGGGSTWATSGIFYRANYSYDNKYLLEFDGRYDGSSKFPLTKQFGFFPSGSVGWIISKENFMSSVRSWLNTLKVRASYGSLGNGNIDPYTFLETVTPTLSSTLVNGVYATYIQNPSVVPGSITWEKATTLDLGADIETLDRRLSATFDWYKRNTTGMITTGQALPAVFGATVPKGNNADLVTRGWELSLVWKDQIGISKPFRYSVRVTFADNESKITKFYNPTGTLSSYYTGQKIGEIWGFVTEGFFTSQEDIDSHANQKYIVVSNSNSALPGDLKFSDLDGNKVINNGSNTIYDPGDKKIIGNSSIRYPYGVTLSAEWLNFSVSAFFQGVGKRDWYPSAEAAYFWGQYNRPYGQMPVANLDRWTEENPSQDAYFPRYRGYVALSGTRELAVTQTRYLQNASYIRLKNLTIAYNLPVSLLNRIKMNAMQLYFTGQNIWTYSPMYKHNKNFDPEVIEGSDPEISGSQGDGNSYPMLKSYTIGLSLSL
ncbi:MAG: TonB-dependent receptor [Agriterribacter sp.]